MSQASQVRTYDPSASVVFLKTNERFGGLSNMAPGFPLRVNGVRIRTSEALYQACRFPHMPEVQQLIIGENSPMTAKMRSKPYRRVSRHDWDFVRVKIMRWCLRVKLAQNWREFGRLLLATGHRPIVEQSRKDDFWGAKVADDGTLVGMNVLGRLLMELREQLKGDEAEGLRFIEPPAISEFLLFGQPIEAVQAAPNAEIPGWPPQRSSQADAAPPPPSDPQPSLFEQPMISSEQAIERRQSTAPDQSGAEPGRYPAYKPAKVHWLGEIPAHWSEKRGKYFFREIDERSQTGEEELLSVSHTTGVTPRSQKTVTMFKAESYVGHKVARPNDVVINTMWAWMSALGVSKNVGIVSPAYGVYRPLNQQDFLPEYVGYLLRTPLLRWEYICRSTGIRSSRLRLYPDKFLDIAFPCPPLPEQERMVAFLRAKEVQIRRLIRNKRRLIGLLNEQKQAIINRAVTRGLNPNAPTKPTGIDWMPEVPAHWDVRMLSRLAVKLQTGPFGSQLHQADYVEDGVPVINPMHLIDGSIRPDRETTVNAKTAERLTRHALTPGEIVIARRGELGRCALVREVDGPMLCGTGCMTLRLSEGVPRFFFEFLSSASVRRFLDERSIGATMQNLNPSIIGSIQTVVPPEDEQEAIIREIEDTNSTFATLEGKAQDEIRLVREYRERMIADVITGKMDVRHIEIAAPADEPIAEEDDALEEELEGDDAEVMEGADADE
ncbi:DUF1768 domain-containing protein [Mesorhizobium sp. CGMCC 1.15528]|uniref:DUF1768 domain-containing protein n=1 Tax=Mesorhizobium zhangyense TaxID=1776730 RepID=A0A7C9VAS3_9HYPH|nr:NADAR domain-containing protein [Mesorhizobium zhangyense]NGN45225.1 DUF1768 domain-containing protein [Mesorhizobium zhangyense]